MGIGDFLSGLSLLAAMASIGMPLVVDRAHINRRRWRDINRRRRRVINGRWRSDIHRLRRECVSHSWSLIEEARTADPRASSALPKRRDDDGQGNHHHSLITTGRVRTNQSSMRKEPRPQVARALPLPLKGKALGELR
jgi:hypothetical protein